MNEAASSTRTADERVTVALGERSYDVVIGDGLIDRAGTLMAAVLPDRRLIVISDENVAPLYLERVLAGCRDAGFTCGTAIVAAGEASKDFATFQALSERLLGTRLDRGTAIVALGGGVVGDLAGFLASVLLRGLPFVQIPTTLLAQVDSSVGGKTGINSRHGKNLIGAFHQPRLVVVDIDTLMTLDRRQLRAGYAEVVKYGLIGDDEFFGWLEENGARLLDGDADARRRAVRTSCAAKAAIVAEDEREAGRRALLNLGHTFGHALEAETGFGDALLHGEAVALGCVLAFRLSARLGLCGPEAGERVRQHLAAAGLPTRLADLAGRQWTSDALIAHMQHDKKIRDGRMTFVLASAIGEAVVARDVDVDHVRAVLDDAIAR
jgi:3-dehydroquinate synthase